FGAFVEVIPGVAGLLPDTQHIAGLSVGDRITVRVRQVDVEQRRVSLTAGGPERLPAGTAGHSATVPVPGHSRFAAMPLGSPPRRWVPRGAAGFSPAGGMVWISAGVGQRRSWRAITRRWIWLVPS